MNYWLEWALLRVICDIHSSAEGTDMTEARPRPTVKKPASRYRLYVPGADEAVNAWMELQDNPSLSIRMLVRECIQQHGYVDLANRPISQVDFPTPQEPLSAQTQLREPGQG